MISASTGFSPCPVVCASVGVPSVANVSPVSQSAGPWGFELIGAFHRGAGSSAPMLDMPHLSRPRTA